MIVTAIYILFMVGAVVWGPLKEPHGHGHDAHGHAHGPLPTDLNLREIVVLAPLAILCLVLGLYPRPLLQALEAPTQQMTQMLDEARKSPDLNRSPEATAGVMPAGTLTPSAPAEPRTAAAGH